MLKSILCKFGLIIGLRNIFLLFELITAFTKSVLRETAMLEAILK